MGVLAVGVVVRRGSVAVGVTDGWGVFVDVGSSGSRALAGRGVFVGVGVALVALGERQALKQKASSNKATTIPTDFAILPSCSFMAFHPPLAVNLPAASSNPRCRLL